ncbi:hypothetical protein KSS87_023240 [Heliosperma pusillum]|nr:hypothetical protein KSS87_023240 [Heliosperma pusillum]
MVPPCSSLFRSTLESPLCSWKFLEVSGIF